MIVRPLLTTTREEILDYLKEEGQSYRQDSSNVTGLYRRNRVRRDLLPVMEDITPGIVRLLERQAEVLRADDAYLEQVVDDLYRSLVSVDAKGDQQFERQAIAALPDALKRRLIRHMLKCTDAEQRPPSLRVIETVLRLLSGRAKGTRVSLRGAEVVRDRERIIIRRKGQGETLDHRSTMPVANHVRVSVPSTVYWPGTGQEIHVQEMTRHAAEPFLKNPTRACAVFDCARLSMPLVLRSWHAGDRIRPRGMGGKSKKLQDLFTDLKLRREERMKIPLLVAPEGILWVVGRREDDRFAVRRSTSRCLVATVHSQAEREGAE
jgi:tRNA(Ile)-lysidine synthase